MTKVCRQCSEEKDVSQFAKKGSSWQYRCLECQRKYFKNYYKGEARRKHIAHVNAYGKRKRAEDAEFLAALKSGPCGDCGGKFKPWQMDFDHVSGKKVKNISTMRGGSRKKMEKELAKCELVCSNCHRDRTHSRSLMV